ncbi:MAG TPA: group II intron reverse transcriptase/maturase [Aquella sp.]|nr:group II intron reverse transcriptase/maturase [Aquella sp.]
MMAINANALPANASWNTLNWELIDAQVKQLQMRIAKAMREGKYRKVNSLQWILTHSYYAKLLAIRRVTQNKGSKTSGVDKIIWHNHEQKLEAANQLNRHGYKAFPLKRIYIPKNGNKLKLRPLSIPTMRDRAMQALYLLALEPVSETCSDKNAYGFRPKRSCADAIGQCFIALARTTSAQWVLEGDIKSCFNEINHKWLLENIPLDKIMLKQWLKSGYIEEQQLYATTRGVAQGGVISPTLLNLTLHGLEGKIKSATKSKDKVNVVIYADDFIITGATKEVLEDTVKPLVINFLAERGLELSQEKTLITHINHGFDFLGFNVRKYKQKLLIKPAKKSVKSFLANIRDIIKSMKTAKTEELINTINLKITGWANYFRHVVAKAIFSKVDHELFQALWAWAKRRHPSKPATWIRKKYFCKIALDNWVFNAGVKPWHGRYKLLCLKKASSVAIVRHIKIQAEANPYNPKYKEYFEKRMVSNGSNETWDI